MPDRIRKSTSERVLGIERRRRRSPAPSDHRGAVELKTRPNSPDLFVQQSVPSRRLVFCARALPIVMQLLNGESQQAAMTPSVVKRPYSTRRGLNMQVAMTNPAVQPIRFRLRAETKKPTRKIFGERRSLLFPSFFCRAFFLFAPMTESWNLFVG